MNEKLARAERSARFKRDQAAVLKLRQAQPALTAAQVAGELGWGSDYNTISRVRQYASRGGLPFARRYGAQREAIGVLRMYEQYAPDYQAVAQVCGWATRDSVRDWRLYTNQNHNLSIPGAVQLKRWGYQGSPTMRLYMVETWLRQELRRLGSLEAIADLYQYPVADLRAWVAQEQITPPPGQPTTALPQRGSELFLSLYPAPQVGAGDWLDDELLGRVQVGGYTNAPIPWPYRRKTGKHSLILTPILAKAVRTEAAQDIAAWWDVSEATIWAWRKALGVDRQNNPGTQRRYRELIGQKITPDAAAAGRAKALEPESRAKALSSIAAGMSTRAPHPETIRWTLHMDALLGTMPDEQAAVALGISKTKVALRRRFLGRPSHRAAQAFQWTPERDALLGTAFDTVLAAQWGISRASVTLRRQALGIPTYRI